MYVHSPRTYRPFDVTFGTRFEVVNRTNLGSNQPETKLSEARALVDRVSYTIPSVT